jgi:mannosyltransferase OCH1-like enzyme
MMIPQKIHYFWFGRGEKSALEQECIARFARYAPGAEIIEWNEDNFDVEAHPYSAKAYRDRKWAFVSDYARLKVLYEQGGVYLDTDMYLVRDLTPLFAAGSFIGCEDQIHISAGIIGAPAGDAFIGDVLQRYDNITERITIPKVLTEVYNLKQYDITVFEPEVFYLYTAETIRNFDKSMPPQNAIAVHMWNYSWGNPMIRLLKKLQIHRVLVIAAERMGIKMLLKKIFKLE